MILIYLMCEKYVGDDLWFIREVGGEIIKKLKNRRQTNTTKYETLYGWNFVMMMMMWGGSYNLLLMRLLSSWTWLTFS